MLNSFANLMPWLFISGMSITISSQVDTSPMRCWRISAAIQYVSAQKGPSLQPEPDNLSTPQPQILFYLTNANGLHLGRLIHYCKNIFLSTGNTPLSYSTRSSNLTYLQSLKYQFQYLTPVPFNPNRIALNDVIKFDLLNFNSCYMAPYNPTVFDVILSKALFQSFIPKPLFRCFSKIMYIPTAAKLESYWTAPIEPIIYPSNYAMKKPYLSIFLKAKWSNIPGFHFKFTLQSLIVQKSSSLNFLITNVIEKVIPFAIQKCFIK